MILSKLVHFPFFLLSACQAPVRKGNLLLTNSCSETTNVRLLSLSLFMEEKLRSYASSDTFNFPPAPRSSLSSRSFLRWLTSLAFACNFHFTTFDHLATFLPSPLLSSPLLSFPLVFTTSCDVRSRLLYDFDFLSYSFQTIPFYPPTGAATGSIFRN